MYATARDWARLGLLYLRDGMWAGRRLYGAHAWLRVPGRAGPETAPIPPDAYSMLGHNQQIVAVVPSRDLVIVRLGLTQNRRRRVHAQILAPIVATFTGRRPIAARRATPRRLDERAMNAGFSRGSSPRP